MRSILAATDFSVDSRHAAHRAALLASITGAARATLLHVVEKSWIHAVKQLVTERGKTGEEILDETSRKLQAIVEEMRKRTGYTLEPYVRTGNTLNEIIRMAREFDLVVLGARGIHRLRSLALGTTSQRLLSKLRQPVLVVKRRPKRVYGNVLVAIDFSPNSAEALTYARTVAPDALVSLVHVFQPLFEDKMMYAGVSEDAIEEYRVKAHLEAEEEMTRFVEATGTHSANFLRHIEYGYAPGKLLDIIDKWSPDLVAVGKHGRSRIEELLLGSVTLHVLSQAHSDVLVAE